jgi:uncharacterized protein YjiS (DUF1127 family)
MIVELHNYFEHKRRVRATINELNMLSDAELQDIGIHRGMIRSIAMEGEYDNLNANGNLKGWV